jgi:hypothetical protein
MGALLSSFPISFLLRSVFAGVSFVVSYYLVMGKDLQQFVDAGNIFSGVLPVALFTGVTVYGLHRSLEFPFLEWAFNSGWAKKIRSVQKDKCIFSLISANTMRALMTRCNQKSKNAQLRDSERAKYMEAWADYIHLQYTFAWCIIAGYITGAIVSDKKGMVHQGIGWFFLAACVFYIAAVVSNWRSHSVDEYFEMNTHSDS